MFEFLIPSPAGIVEVLAALAIWHFAGRAIVNKIGAWLHLPGMQK